MGTETVTSLAKAGDGEGLKLHIKVCSLFFKHNQHNQHLNRISITQVLYCLAVVSLALHLLTILYAAFGLSEMAYRQPEEAFGLPDLEKVFVREKPSEEERVQNENWRERKEEGRERREVKQGGRGDVEFVHPDLKKELLKQGEDPANPWVWLTSYSRIPVTFSLIKHF